MDKERQPKETDAIKHKLESFAALQRKIDNAIKRLESLTLTMDSPSAPNLTGMPSGGGDGSSKTERQVIRKLELEEKIRRMERDERELRHELEELIDLMEKPDEQIVIQMRYLDGVKWWTISTTLFGEEPDYDSYDKRYLKRTFKIHGSALQSLTRIYKSRQ